MSEIRNPKPEIRWRWGWLAGAALAVLALFPQLRLWQTRGAEWQGVYAYNDIDEVAYAAYLNALIDGRPRRNDPYTGRDDTPQARQPESIFSIQFIPPLTVALVARLFGMSASGGMILLSVLAGLGAGLTLFWLLRQLAENNLVALTGALAVVCLGTLLTCEGGFNYLQGGTPYPYLPVFRRYIPAFGFPFFILFAGCAWRCFAARSDALEAKKNFARGIWDSDRTENEFYKYLTLSLLFFAVLLFSYFYLWTTALALAASLFCVCFDMADWRAWLKRGAYFFGGLAIVAVPYLYLLSCRAPTTDAIQLLERTHVPDLMRSPEIVCYVVLTALFLGVGTGLLNWRDARARLTCALVLTPFALFNQQILTGRSLQPIHYEVFTGNYVAALAAVSCLIQIALGFAAQKRSAALASAPLELNSLSGEHGEVEADVTPVNIRKSSSFILYPLALSLLAGAIYGWGLFEANVTSAVLDEANLDRDKAMPLMRRLKELGAHDKLAAHREIVFSTELGLTDELPSHAPQSVLWARHQHIFAGVSWQENKERLYQHLYYVGLDENWLRGALEEGNFVIIYGLFGWGRLHDRLINNPQPITRQEINAEVNAFAAYCTAFNRATAARFPLSYVIVRNTDGDTDENYLEPENVSRWYEITGAGETFGDYVLYRVRLKP